MRCFHGAALLVFIYGMASCLKQRKRYLAMRRLSIDRSLRTMTKYPSKQRRLVTARTRIFSELLKMEKPLDYVLTRS